MLNLIEIGISLKIFLIYMFIRPVHEFLYRHIYTECIYSMKISCEAAKFWTFAFSAAVHEFIAVFKYKISSIL